MTDVQVGEPSSSGETQEPLEFISCKRKRKCKLLQFDKKCNRTARKTLMKEFITGNQVFSFFSDDSYFQRHLPKGTMKKNAIDYKVFEKVCADFGSHVKVEDADSDWQECLLGGSTEIHVKQEHSDQNPDTENGDAVKQEDSLCGILETKTAEGILTDEEMSDVSIHEYKEEDHAAFEDRVPVCSSSVLSFLSNSKESEDSCGDQTLPVKESAETVEEQVPHLSGLEPLQFSGIGREDETLTLPGEGVSLTGLIEGREEIDSKTLKSTITQILEHEQRDEASSIPSAAEENFVYFNSNSVRFLSPVKIKITLSDKERDEVSSKSQVDPCLNCFSCDRKFRNFAAFYRHIEQHRKRDKTLQCFYCPKSFRVRCDRTKHMRVHTGEKPFSCSQCNKKFSLSGNLRKHERTHTGEKHLACETCGKYFARKEHLKKHILIHSEDKPFKCDRCSKEYSSKYCLNIHMKIHDKIYDQECSHCGKKFYDLSTLRKHERCHTGEKPYMCLICGSKFADTNRLKLHLTTHSSERPFQCSQCPLTFKTKKALGSHLKGHSNTSFHSCRFCSKQFGSKHNRDCHESIHTGERSFVCNECSKAFRTRTDLLKHIVIHSSEKKYSCNLCPARFHRNNRLKKHLDSHSGYKPFGCDVCEKLFVSSISLEKHTALFHSPDSRKFPCNFCGKIFKREIYVSTHKCHGRKDIKIETTENG